MQRKTNIKPNTMMKKILLLPALLLAFAPLFAQKVESKNVQVGTMSVPGFTMTIPKDAKLVQDALNNRLREADLKTKKAEGFIAVLNQLFSEISTDPINLYTLVEKDGRNKAKVTVCVIPTDLSINRDKIQDNLRDFLEGFSQYVTRFEAKNNMAAEQDNLKKAQKKHASAVGAVEKIDKSIQKDQEKIADKKKEIEKYKAKIAELQEDIKDLEASIAKSQGKKTDAQKDVDDAHSNVKSVEGEVEKYRSIAE